MYATLCAGRHEIPNDPPSIFGGIADVTDTDGMLDTAIGFIDNYGVKRLDLYVTGLSVALVAVINACRVRHVPLTLWHFNRETNDYYTQMVLN